MTSTEAISLTIGAAGLIVGVYQTLSARKTKQMYRNNCRMRIRDATDNAERLADNVVQLCRYMDSVGFAKLASQDPTATRSSFKLSQHIGATLDVTKAWVRFCLRLDEEHHDEFNETVISTEERRHLRTLKDCMHDFDDLDVLERQHKGQLV